MSWLKQGHVYDAIGHLLDGKKNLYIYGAGGMAKELVLIIKVISSWTKWNVYFVDRDVTKQKEGRYGYSVMSPETFFEIEKQDYFVIIGADGKVADEIYGILRENIGSKEVIFRAFYFIHTYLSIYFAYIHDMVFFGSENMLLSTVCNLNCRDCLNFTPYIKEHHIETFEQIKKVVDLFFNAVDLVYRFQLTGGEPLLYKDIIRAIEYIGDNYRNKIISLEIVTNGTIVPTDELCTVLEKYRFRVFLDDYRNSIDNGKEKYNKCLQKFSKYKIDLVENYVSQWFRMYIPEIDEKRYETEKELIRKFRLCDNPWSNLWHGKISACNYAFYAYKAGLCEWDETAAYDLEEFDESKKKELVEFRLRQCEKGYVGFCKKCSGWSAINNRWCEPAIQMKR